MLDRPGLLAAGPPIFTCTTNKSISDLAGSQMASLQTLYRGSQASQSQHGYCKPDQQSGAFEGLDIQQGGYECLKGTNKLLRLGSDQCLCFSEHQRPETV